MNKLECAASYMALSRNKLILKKERKTLLGFLLIITLLPHIDRLFKAGLCALLIKLQVCFPVT